MCTIRVCECLCGYVCEQYSGCALTNASILALCSNCDCLDWFAGLACAGGESCYKKATDADAGPPQIVGSHCCVGFGGQGTRVRPWHSCLEEFLLRQGTPRTMLMALPAAAGCMYERGRDSTWPVGMLPSRCACLVCSKHSHTRQGCLSSVGDYCKHRSPGKRMAVA